MLPRLHHASASAGLTGEDEGTLQRHMMTCPGFVMLAEGAEHSTDLTHVPPPARKQSHPAPGTSPPWASHGSTSTAGGLPYHFMPGPCWQELLGQLVFIRARPTAPGVCAKQDALLFRLEKGQSLSSRKQTETKCTQSYCHGQHMAGKRLWPVNTGCFCRRKDTIGKKP